MRIEISEASEGLWLDEHYVFSLTEIVALSGLSIAEMQNLVDCEALLPVAAVEPAADLNASQARFSAHCLALARAASRLRTDFDLDANGLALTLRSVRMLRDQLLSHKDWDAAGHAYAESHDHDYQVIHTVEDWLRAMFLETGLQAQARRARALPLIAQDGTRMPDLYGLGPETPIGETVGRRFFGEETRGRIFSRQLRVVHRLLEAIHRYVTEQRRANRGQVEAGQFEQAARGGVVVLASLVDRARQRLERLH